MSDEKETQFTGVWVPEAVIMDKRLLPREKLIAGYVLSMCMTTKGCIASNAHIAGLFGVSARWVSTIVNKLIEYGYCFLDNFNGKRRRLRTVFGTEAWKHSSMEPQFQADRNHSSRQTGTTVPPYNKEDSKVDIKEEAQPLLLEEEPPPKEKEEKVLGYKATCDDWQELHVKETGSKPDFTGKNCKLLIGLIKRHGSDVVRKKLRLYYTLPLWFTKDKTFEMGQFSGHFDAIPLNGGNGQAVSDERLAAMRKSMGK